MEAMVRIHEGLYVDALMVISVQAFGADKPSEEHCGDLNCTLCAMQASPPSVKVVWAVHDHQAAAHVIACDNMDAARKLARKIMRRVNRGRGLTPPILREGSFSGTWDAQTPEEAKAFREAFGTRDSYAQGTLTAAPKAGAADPALAEAMSKRVNQAIEQFERVATDGEADARGRAATTLRTEFVAGSRALLDYERLTLELHTLIVIEGGDNSGMEALRIKNEMDRIFPALTALEMDEATAYRHKLRDEAADPSRQNFK